MRWRGGRPTRALVTGGAGGIGRAVARALAAEQISVVISDRSLAAAEAARAEIAREFPAAELWAAALDVTEPTGFARLEREAGPFDLLVNNAGLGQVGEVRDLTLEDWEPLLAVNLRGVIHGVQALYPAMAGRGRGWILNVASGAGLAPRPGMTPYATTKAAVIGLSASLRAEGGPLGVRVCCACPGYVGTGIQDASRFVGVSRERLLSGIPLRPLTAERCAERLVRGLARDQALILPNRVTRLEWWLGRLSPWLGGVLGRWRGGRIRAARLTVAGPP
ncbi:MAG: SDR family oxidoreductase [Planctomycetes bacterium]|nr:SDR family oxidoreductase [Planctomycetota bacterium]